MASIFTVRERILLCLLRKEGEWVSGPDVSKAIRSKSGNTNDMFRELVADGALNKRVARSKKGKQCIEYSLTEKGLIQARTQDWRMRSIGANSVKTLSPAKRGNLVYKGKASA